MSPKKAQKLFAPKSEGRLRSNCRGGPLWPPVVENTRIPMKPYWGISVLQRIAQRSIRAGASPSS